VKAWAIAAAALALAATASGASGPRSLAAKCGDTSGVHAVPFWLRATDGVRLYAIDTGKGDVGVVLLHESPGDLCGWLPFIADLTHAGIRALAFDFRGYGDSGLPQSATQSLAFDRDVRAAVYRLGAEGVRKVFLVGASFGGAAALTYAPSLPLAGVVSLSGEADLPRSGLDAAAAMPHLHAPLLIVGSRRDPYLPVRQALRLLHRAGSKDKRTAFYPGAFHGWDIVEDAPYAARARALVLAWIRARS